MAATNTMTGWLYVLSAVGLVLAAILPVKSLQALSFEHLPPNLTLGKIDPLPIERVLAQGTYIAKIRCLTNRRGVYRWDRISHRFARGNQINIADLEQYQDSWRISNLAR
jgi:uncharacterized protein (DUF58 family)